MIATLLIVLVALLHIYFLILEMFFWTKPLGLKVFRLTPEKAQISAPLAQNQGLYNGFLAAGLVYGTVASEPVAFSFKVFFLLCVVLAGSFGAMTVNKRIFYVQALPALIALAATFFI